MKPAIFLPDDLATRLDAVAQAHGMNRSEFFQRAGVRYADFLEADNEVARINFAVDAVGSTENPGRRAAQTAIESGAWEW